MDDGTDDESVYAGQPAICLASRHVYDGTTCTWGWCVLSHCVNNQKINAVRRKHATV